MENTSKIIEINRYDFARWLSTKQPHSIVGLAKNGLGCPIHEFLEASTGNRVGYVAPDCIKGSSSEYFFTPRWAARFIRKLDTGLKFNEPITAQEALAVLSVV